MGGGACRAHLLSRLLRPAINGTAHCVTLPPPPSAAGLPAVAGGAAQAAQRSTALRAFFAGLQAHSPRRDTARLDVQSDVVKWMQLENRSLKCELKTARDKAAMLQKFVASHGEQEVKTWELWQELEVVRASAAALRAEVDALQAELHSARSTAAAASAAADIAGERADAEASMRVGACREAASAAARAAAMEAAADRMARQLADTSPMILHGVSGGGREHAAAGEAFQGEANSSSVAGGGVVDRRPPTGDANAQQAVSVQLTVAEGRVSLQMTAISEGNVSEHGTTPQQLPQHVPVHAVAAAAPSSGSANMPAHGTGSRSPGADDGVAAAALLDLERRSHPPDAARSVHDTLNTALAAAAQQHELRCEQAQRAAAQPGVHGDATESSVLSLLALLVRILTPFAAAPSSGAPSIHAPSHAGVTPSASAGSLDAPLLSPQPGSSRAASHAAAPSLASASEASPRPSDPAAAALVSIAQAPIAAHLPGNSCAAGGLAGDARPTAESPLAPVRASIAGAGAATLPHGSGGDTGMGHARDRVGPQLLSGLHQQPVSPLARTKTCSTDVVEGTQLTADGLPLDGLRTAWPTDLDMAPQEWVSALVTVLQLPRVLEGRINSLVSQVCCICGMWLMAGWHVEVCDASADTHVAGVEAALIVYSMSAPGGYLPRGTSHIASVFPRVASQYVVRAMCAAYSDPPSAG